MFPATAEVNRLIWPIKAASAENYRTAGSLQISLPMLPFRHGDRNALLLVHLFACRVTYPTLPPHWLRWQTLDAGVT